MVSTQSSQRLKSLLAQLNINDKETDIYIFLFSHGAQAGSVIAKKIGINRTSVYHILEKLEEKNLIYSFKKNNIRFYSVCDLDRAIYDLNSQKEKIENQKNALMSLSEISSQQFENLDNSDAELEYIQFESLEKKIDFIKQIIHENNEILCFYNSTNTPQDYEITASLITRHNLTKNTNLKILCGGPQSHNIIPPQNFNGEIHHIPDFPFPESSLILIGNNEVATIDESYAFYIKSNYMAELFESNFHYCWSLTHN